MNFYKGENKMTITIERVFELTDNDIEYLATRWDCHPEDVADRIANGDFEIEELRDHSYDDYYDYGTVLVK
jgi:hypothetical protein